jgi:hypothetical protein
MFAMFIVITVRYYYFVQGQERGTGQVLNFQGQVLNFQTLLQVVVEVMMVMQEHPIHTPRRRSERRVILVTFAGFDALHPSPSHQVDPIKMDTKTNMRQTDADRFTTSRLKTLSNAISHNLTHPTPYAPLNKHDDSTTGPDESIRPIKSSTSLPSAQ